MKNDTNSTKTKRLILPRRPSIVAATILIVLVGGYGIFQVVSQPTHQISSAFHQARCPFRVDSDLVEGQNVRCGFLTVPEDRSQPKGHTIQLAVAIFKTPNPQLNSAPLLILGGGPGVPLLSTVGPIMANGLNYFAQGHDLILLDQRGAGFSQPSLNCQTSETVQECHDRLVKQGINLSAYTTPENAADIHNLVKALGYQQVNLEGDSYGTRLALTVMRLYPSDVHSAILRSIFPPQVNFFTIRATLFQHAFDNLFRGCSTETQCNATYPHLQTVFYNVISALNKKPISFVPMNAQASVRLTGTDLMNWLFDALYRTYLIPTLPKIIAQISRRNYTLLSQSYNQGLNTAMSMGMFYSMMCSDGFASTTLQALTASVYTMAPELQTGMLASLRDDYQNCQTWHVQPVAAVQEKPVVSDIPTLLMEGEYDPVTPPMNGILAAQTLNKSFFVQFPALGHDLQADNSCPTDIENAFLQNPTQKPDTSCTSGMLEPNFW